MIEVVFIRHGQSQWNLENRFTGWVDVDLSERGIGEARQAGEDLKARGFEFDIAYTSLLKRAIRTLWLVLDITDQMYVPIDYEWRLNERHYGALQGLDKKQTVARHGADQVLRWRRGYATQPPALEGAGYDAFRNDRRYRQLETVPATESLADTVARVVPWWQEVMVPALKTGKRPVVAAHGNSLRAIVKYLDNMSEEAITGLNIPTGMPLVYRFDDQLEVVGREYIADPEKVAAAEREVANQTRQSS